MDKHEIESKLGFKIPTPPGYHMWIMVHTEKNHKMKDDGGNLILDLEGKPCSLELPKTVLDRDKFINLTGLVISQGPDAYYGERFERSGPWCKVGDWIMMRPNEGTQFNYRGVSMRIINDDRILSVVEDPSYVTRD